MAVVVTMLGATTVDAMAAQSLSGDMLYTWKRTKEQITLALTMEPGQRAQMHADVAARRLGELSSRNVSSRRQRSGADGAPDLHGRGDRCATTADSDVRRGRGGDSGRVGRLPMPVGPWLCVCCSSRSYASGAGICHYHSRYLPIRQPMSGDAISWCGVSQRAVRRCPGHLALLA
jgi:hypothetical protein